MERTTPETYAASLDRLVRLTREAARTGPALIAWPETAVRQLGADRLLQARLSALVDELGSALVVGASDVEKFARPGGQQLGRRAHNAAYLVEPGRPLAEPYRKMRLVPFGEYVPFEGRVPWPAWLVPGSIDGVAGEGRLFGLASGPTLATLICWENLFADMSGMRSRTAPDSSSSSRTTAGLARPRPPASTTSRPSFGQSRTGFPS